MKPLRQVSGRAAILDRPDVDTDQIIPKQFLKRIERSGYGEFLFFDWMKDPDFELRRPEYEGAQILVAGRNFGCGSSREHAAWSLEDAGFRVVLAPSFGDIFRTNATKTGMAPIVLPEDALEQIKAALAAQNELTVDLEALEIRHPNGLDPALRVRRVRPPHAASRASTTSVSRCSARTASPRTRRPTRAASTHWRSPDGLRSIGAMRSGRKEVNAMRRR